jgi:hypothetical protein
VAGNEYAVARPRRPVPLRLLVACAALVAALVPLTSSLVTAAPMPAMFAIIAIVGTFVLFVMLVPPLREVLAVDFALSGTASPSAHRRAQSVSYLAQRAATLPPFAKEVLPDVLIRATMDPDSSVRWQGMASCVRAAAHLPSPGRRLLVEAVLAAADRDQVANVRAGAARALVAIMERAPPDGEVHLMDRLPGLVEDEDTGVVATWCDALPRVTRATGEPAPSALIDALLRLANSSEPVSKWAARRAMVSVGALAMPAARASVLGYIIDHTRDEKPQARVDALEELMEITPALDPEEAARVRRHLEELGSAGDPAVAGFVLLAWAVASRPGAPGQELPPSLAGAPGGNPRLVRAARAIAASQSARVSGAPLEGLEVNRSAGPVVDLVAEFESEEALVRRLARASLRAAFPLLAVATRQALIGALLEMHAKAPQPARTNASAALVDVRATLTHEEVHRVALGLVALMAEGHESVRRQATVTAVGLMPHALPETGAALYAALRKLAQDPDAVVADQAKDSLMALREDH